MLHPGRSLNVGRGKDLTTVRPHAMPFTCITTPSPQSTLGRTLIIHILLMRKHRQRKIAQAAQGLPQAAELDAHQGCSVTQSPLWHCLVTPDMVNIP